MGFFSNLFSSKSAPPPLGDPTSPFSLARFLAWDYKNPPGRWVVDTCLRADINMANANFAWEAMDEARRSGDESFMRGALFVLQLIGASATTRGKLTEMMRGH